MDELRLSLLALFVVLIAGLYLRETLRKRRTPRPQAQAPVPPHDDASSSDAPDAVMPGATLVETSAGDGSTGDPLAGDSYAPGAYGHDDRFGHEIADTEPAYLDPAPAAEFSSLADSAEPARTTDSDGGSASALDGATATPVDAFSTDGRDVPLGDIQLLAAQTNLAGDAGPGASTDNADFEAALREVEDEPFRQGQLDLDGRTQRHEPTLSPGALSTGTSGEQLIVVLHVMRSDGTEMPAGNVQAALGTAQLELGEMSIYHHYGLTFGGAHQPVFSVARAVEPGTFDAEDERTYATPGLTLFMRLPGPQDGAVVLELMFNTAQTLARDLEADVLDERRNAMSAQALNHLRDRVAEFSRRQKLVAS